MTQPHAFETVTDATKAAEIIHRYIRRNRVEYPDDLAELISEIAAELMCSVDSCHRADFLLREKNDKAGATRSMQEVMNAITTFKNQLGFLVSQADYCLHGVKGTRLSGDQYQHNPNNNLPVLPTKMIAASLESIKTDFRGWRVERRTEGWMLVVETNPILIEDPRFDVVVNFGPFNIELQLAQLARGVSKPYHIVALEPNIVTDHGGIPHPHVRSKLLCEGKGEPMIRKALKVGDIQSFLIVVSQILSTYNPGSPYLRLEYWSKKLPRGPNPRPHAGFGDDQAGENECSACHDPVDDPYECNLCGNLVCEDCSAYCDNHSRTLCNRCVERLRTERRGCASCADFGAAGCSIEVRTECADCGDRFLSSEMVRCGPRNRYMCSSCFNQRARDHRPCCSQWENTRNCQMARHLPRNEAGFANTINVNPAPMEQPAMPAAETPRRRDGFIDTAPDDGVGGFAPPQGR